MINWVTSWGGPLGTASGQQVTIPIEPILDQTKLVSPDAALQISSVYACVELLAQTLSTLPLFVYRERADGGREPDKTGRLWYLLHERPNAWMTPCEFISAMVVNRMLRGNAYVLIERDSDGLPIALIPLSADQMEVSIIEGGEVYTYSVVYDAPAMCDMIKPYAVVMVRTDDGVMIAGQLVDVDLEKVAIGMRVRAVMRKLSTDGESGIIRYGYKFVPAE